MGAAVAVPAVLGAVGLSQAAKAQSDQKKATNKALKVSERESAAKLDIMDILKGIADSYDPKAETAASVGYAQDVAGQSLERGLRGLRASYKGGNPTGDSEYHVSAQRAANDALDPLKAFAANQASTETARKSQLYALAAGTPVGDLSRNYFQAAAMMPQANFAPSASMLAQSLQQLFSQGPKNQSLAAQSGPEDIAGSAARFFGAFGGR